jgi:hypothetical protein
MSPIGCWLGERQVVDRTVLPGPLEVGGDLDAGLLPITGPIAETQTEPGGVGTPVSGLGRQLEMVSANAAGLVGDVVDQRGCYAAAACAGSTMTS